MSLDLLNLYITYALSLTGIFNIQFAYFIYKKKLIGRYHFIFFTSFSLVLIIANLIYPTFLLTYLLLIYNICLFICIVLFRHNWILASFTIIYQYGLTTLTWLICYDTPFYFSGASTIILSPLVNIPLQLVVFTSLLSGTHLLNKRYPNFFNLLSRAQKKQRLVSITCLVVFFITAFFRQTILSENYLSDIWFFLFCFLTLLAILYLTIFISEKNSLTKQLTYILDEQKKNFFELQQFKHDYRSILYSLDAYLEIGNLSGADHYLKDILAYSDTILLSEQRLSLNKIAIIELKSLLSETLKKLEPTNVTSRLIVHDTIFLVNMNMIDFIRCLSILLNNAVEEVLKFPDTPDVFFTMELSAHDQQCHIRISNYTENSYPLGTLLKKKWSSKDSHSGLGLYIFTNIIQQYNNVTYNIKNSNQTFTVELIVPLPSNSEQQ